MHGLLNAAMSYDSCDPAAELSREKKTIAVEWLSKIFRIDVNFRNREASEKPAAWDRIGKPILKECKKLIRRTWLVGRPSLLRASITHFVGYGNNSFRDLI